MGKARYDAGLHVDATQARGMTHNNTSRSQAAV